MANEGNSSGSILLAFVLGAAAGAAIALLYAPATGEETRDLLEEGIAVMPLPIPPREDWH